MAVSVGAASSTKARAQSRRYSDLAQVPLLLAVELDQKAKATPEDAAAQLLGRLVGVLHRNLSGVKGIVSRSAKCWQMILRGERPPTLLDLVEVILHPSREARAAGHEVAGILLDAMRPADGTLPGQAVATLLQEVTEAVGAYSKAMDDGELDVEEIDRVLHELADVQRVTSSLRAVLDSQRRRLIA